MARRAHHLRRCRGGHRLQRGPAEAQGDLEPRLRAGPRRPDGVTSREAARGGRAPFPGGGRGRRGLLRGVGARGGRGAVRVDPGRVGPRRPRRPRGDGRPRPHGRVAPSPGGLCAQGMAQPRRCGGERGGVRRHHQPLGRRRGPGGRARVRLPGPEADGQGHCASTGPSASARAAGRSCRSSRTRRASTSSRRSSRPTRARTGA